MLLNTPCARALVDALEFEIPPMTTQVRRVSSYVDGTWRVYIDAASTVHPGDGTTAEFEIVETDGELEAWFVAGFDW